MDEVVFTVAGAPSVDQIERWVSACHTETQW